MLTERDLSFFETYGFFIIYFIYIPKCMYLPTLIKYILFELYAERLRDDDERGH